MIWKLEHFKLLDVSGLAHMWYSHPTKGHCDPVENGCKADFTDLSRLPYCKEYKGTLSFHARASCMIQDFVELIPTGSSDDKIFVPTSVEVFTEALSCPSGSTDEHRCSYKRLPGTNCLAHGKYMCQTRDGQRDQFFYVADAERYQLRFTSSFDRNGMAGTSLEYPGYLGICERLRPPTAPRTWGQRKAAHSAERDCHGEDSSEFTIKKIDCLEGKVCVEMRNFDVEKDVFEGGRRDLAGALREDLQVDISDTEEQENATTRERHRAESFFLRPRSWRRGRSHRAGHKRQPHSLLSSRETTRDFLTPETEFTTPNYGDVFTLGRLLELAGANLDLDRTFDGLSLRQAGTALEVRVVYSNMYPFYSSFGYHEVNYHYEVKELMMPAMERYVLAAAQPPDYPAHRRYELQHGVLVWFKVDGRFGFFSFLNFFILLAAAATLITSTKVIVDLFAIYVHPDRRNYFHLMHDVSSDFSNMWSCPKCGFKNLAESERCQGIPCWVNPREEPKCMTPMPPPV